MSSEPVLDPATTAAPVDASDGLEWLRTNWITAAAILGLVLELWWRAGIIEHSYFQQGDFPLLYRAAATKLDLAYLLAPSNGQIDPGAQAIVWLEARAGVYNWDVASAAILVMLALAGLALLRLLRTLLGNRPIILVPFALYLATPLIVPVLTWWSSTLAWLPLHIATFMAINAHVHYVRTGRFWHAVVAALWMAVGVLFLDKGVLIPLLLVGLTSGFLLPGRWASSLISALRRYWRGWLLYTAVMGAYLGLAVVKLSGSGFTPRPLTGSSALSFTSSLIRVGIVPGVLGGPWRWWTTGSYAAAAVVPVLTTVSWLIAAGAVAASVWFRRRGWRAWLILAGWVVIADLLPVWAGWVGLISTPPFTADLSYVADAVPVITVCVALAFWPAQGEEIRYRAPRPPGATRTLITFNVVAVIIVGSLWSAHSYETVTTGQAARSYIATARVALRNAPPGADIFSAPVPTAVMSGSLFGPASNTAAVLGPLAPRRASVRWTTSPRGVAHQLMIFDSEGRLWPAAVVGDSTAALVGPGTCWRLGAREVRIPLQRSLYKWPWFAEFGYSGPATTLALSFSGSWRFVEVAAGHHNVLTPFLGAGRSVTVRNLDATQHACLTYLTVGTVEPSAFGAPIPAGPVSN